MSVTPPHQPRRPRILKHLCRSTMLMVPATLAMGALSETAAAQDFGLAGGVSTLGFFIEPSYGIADNMRLRAPIYYAKYDTSLEDDGNTVDGSIKSLTGAVAVDYFPMASGFFVSGGVAFGGYKFTGNTTQIQAEGYTYDGNFGVTMDQKSNVSPQLSLGYRGTPREGMSLSVELGARFATYEVAVSGTESLTSEGQENVAKELRSINDSLSDWPVVPFVSLSVGWLF